MLRIASSGPNPAGKPANIHHMSAAEWLATSHCGVRRGADHRGGALEARVPAPAVGDHLIVVETYYPHVPLFDVGISTHEFHHTVATRPRYVPQVLWAGV